MFAVATRSAIRSTALALVFAAAVTGAASAQDTVPYKGYYVSGIAGFGALDGSNVTGTGIDARAKFDDGFAGALAFGHAYGTGLRVEGELARRANDVDNFSGTNGQGDVTATSVMVNGLYDFNIGARIVPYVGAGLGIASVNWDASPIGGSSADDSDTVFVWQAMIGVTFPISDSLALTAEARHFDAGNQDILLASGTSVKTAYQNDSLMIGLRWNLGVPKAPVQTAPVPAPAPVAESVPMVQVPAPMPVPQPAPAPEPAAQPRAFLIFFDWDKSNIRPDAQQILEAAARLAKQGKAVRIALTGHADRSGTTRYNQGLSERRAAAAKAVMVALGIPANAISTVGRGESQPLVATADGVREPRNRRVEIQF
jgi:OOP family OmpA-OmpF porin